MWLIWKRFYQAEEGLGVVKSLAKTAKNAMNKATLRKHDEIYERLITEEGEKEVKKKNR